MLDKVFNIKVIFLFMLIDGHIDVVFSMKLKPRNFAQRSGIGHVDFPRMKEGGVTAAFFAVFPASNDFVIAEGVNSFFNLIENKENNLSQIKRVEDFVQTEKSGKIGAILHFEGSGGLDSEFINLRNYYRLGLRSMGLSWSNYNKFATGVGTIEERGLTAEGRELVKEMEKLGIVVDVSHLNEKSFWDVIEVASKPIIASHSNAYAVCKHPRNLTDEQIKAIAELKGTIGINFSVNFLSEKKDANSIQFEDIYAHIEHIVNLVGIDHVSFGSDYDGTDVPMILKDISYYPKLLEFLEKKGFSRDDIEKIAYKNFLRVFKNVWK
ncbi:MAG: membrane dipeptidase [Bacteroidetes bacterium]|nr:MAG: membrane dipeptidase [Bacteroidota bacterium]